MLLREIVAVLCSRATQRSLCGHTRNRFACSRRVRTYVREASSPPRTRTGMTLVELMVTVLIGAILATTLGVFFVRLLNIQEQEREEAYVREKIVEITAAYADYLSIALAISNNATATSFTAIYPQETGGVSFETGRVTRVTHLNTFLDADNRTLILDSGHFEADIFISGFQRSLHGDALLVNLTNDLVCVNGSMMIRPLDAPSLDTAHLVYLNVAAHCECENGAGKKEMRNVMSGRIVRLWNRE